MRNEKIEPVAEVVAAVGLAKQTFVVVVVVVETEQRQTDQTAALAVVGTVASLEAD